MTPVCKPLIPGQFYRLIVSGKHYPNVYKKIVDMSGAIVYDDNLPVSAIHPLIDTSLVISGGRTSVEIGNLGSVHAEKLFNHGFISPAYNAREKSFEIRYYERPYIGGYRVVASTKRGKP